MTLGELIEDKDKLKVQEIQDIKEKYFNESRALFVDILEAIPQASKSNEKGEKALYQHAKNTIKKLDAIFHKIEKNKKVKEPYEKRRKKTNQYLERRQITNYQWINIVIL